MTMDEELPLDAVTDLIANIEMHRREIEKEAGLEASRNYALRRLQQSLAHEQEELQQRGATPLRQAVIDALSAEVRRVGTLARSAAPRPQQRGDQARRQQNFRPEAQRNRPKSRGRRSMGRNSGR